MPLAILGVAVLLLLLLIGRFKLNAFLALIMVSFVVAVANGMGPDGALKSILRGIGDTMGSLVLILVFGAMLGKLIEESGAAHTITHGLTALFGRNRLQLSVLLTGFVVGLPMIYNASFLVLIPLIYTLSATTGLPLMHLGIPLSSALSVTHGYLPPHPAPISIAVLYGASANRVLLYGLILAVPATLLAGPVLARFFRHLDNRPPAELYSPREFRKEELPGLAVSLFSTLVPVLLMLAGGLAEMWLKGDGPLAATAKFLSNPNVALFVAAVCGLYFLGLKRGKSMDDLMKSAGAAAASVSMVVLIIAAGGAFKQVLLDCGAGAEIQKLMSQAHFSPILLAWLTAALLRLAVGSATVAAITAAGIVLPVVPGCGTAPELLVLATTSGSLMFSHFNDIGFWMFKEYYNVSIRQTFQIWTLMESIVAAVGLIGVLLLNLILGPVPARAAGSRVFYVNSYHGGYPSSDAAMGAITGKLRAAGVDLRVAFLDAKRHGDSREIERTASAILQEIHSFQPQLVIASDDDAVKNILAPHFRSGPVPGVFCGVNWSSGQYGLPSPNVTGMLEVVPVGEVLEAVRKQRPSIRKLVVLSEDSISERSNRTILESRYREWGFDPQFVLVSGFEEWKRWFEKAQLEADVIYLPTNGAIKDWDVTAARAWVALKMRKPVVTCDDFMMAYCALGITKVAREQGEWAAQAALRILNGESPARIRVEQNRQTRCFWNPQLAEKAGLQRPAGMNCDERQ